MRYFFWVVILMVLSVFTYADVDFYIRPQFKIGKIENGNRFAEIQYLKGTWWVNDDIIVDAGASTGFTAPRSGKMVFNHSINRLGIKVKYKVSDTLGIFYEGSFTDNIPGANNPVSYFVYDTYQSFGLAIDIFEVNLK